MAHTLFVLDGDQLREASAQLSALECSHNQRFCEAIPEEALRVGILWE